MEFQTTHHGIREYDETEVITFKKGLPGFEGLRKFILFPAEENEVFNILHSVENPEVGLVTISPFTVDKEYEVELKEGLIKRLNIEKPEDVLLQSTVTLNSNLESITVNLKAPIIINISSKSGEQIILDNDKYLIKHPLIQE
ncbi:MAG TPA: flagellar assembly protein FliW [Clostridium sp.]|jgi:flagellar assembly factor FliW|nr:flagellar assembly protein FliW [Clostridia bacterium]HCW03409.1 flagellar assembly protein FliW [Clostridium sp.]